MSQQLTLSFEAALPDRFGTLREYLAHRVTVQERPAKSIAADMDMSPSLLSRKLNPSEADTQRFNLDDLEAYLRASGDAMAVVEYLLAKYAPSAEEDRKQRAQARVVELLEGLPTLLAAAGFQAPGGAHPRRGGGR